MSGLDGGGGASASPAGGNDGTGGEDVSVRSQPGHARNPNEQSNDLDARIQARKLAAERGDAAPENLKGQRGPDGKFLPRNGQAPEPVNNAASDEAEEHGEEREAPKAKAAAPKADPAHEKLKTEHAAATKERDHFKGRDAEWTKIGERAMARLDSQTAYIEHLEAKLAEHGGSVDPQLIENATLKERIRAIELAEERAANEAERSAAQEQEARRAAARQHLTDTTKAALSKHPALLKSGPDLKEYLTLVYRGGDPTTLAEVFNQRALKHVNAAANPPMAPRTLAGRGAGSGGPRLTDPRDIADKWKRRIGANA